MNLSLSVHFTTHSLIQKFCYTTQTGKDRMLFPKMILGFPWERYCHFLMSWSHTTVDECPSTALLCHLHFLFFGEIQLLHQLFLLFLCRLRRKKEVLIAHNNCNPRKPMQRQLVARAFYYNRRHWCSPLDFVYFSKIYVYYKKKTVVQVTTENASHDQCLVLFCLHCGSTNSVRTA